MCTVWDFVKNQGTVATRKNVNRQYSFVRVICFFIRESTLNNSRRFADTFVIFRLGVRFHGAHSTQSTQLVGATLVVARLGQAQDLPLQIIRA